MAQLFGRGTRKKGENLHRRFQKNTQEILIEETILEHYNEYYRLAYSYVKNEADAGDIVQNGAYKALRASHTLTHQEYVNTWVYRIMLNEIFRYLKQPKWESYDFLQEEGSGDMAYTEDSYEDLDLQRALDALPEQEKAIITMKYFEDKKLDEIAEILNENLSTVKSRLYRSMKKLRLILSEEEATATE